MSYSPQSTERPPRRPRRARALLVGLILLTSLAAPLASRAVDLVCVRVEYWLLGGPKQTPVDECYVPTSWSILVGSGSGPGCVSYNDPNVSPPPTVKVCHYAHVAGPV